MAKAMKAAASSDAHEWVEVTGFMKHGIYGCLQLMLKKSMKKAAKKPAMKAAMKKAFQAKKATKKK